MILEGTIASQFASGAGSLAAAIGVAGFLAHSRPAIAGKSEVELRRATAIGGICGFALALAVTFISAVG